MEGPNLIKLREGQQYRPVSGVCGGAQADSFVAREKYSQEHVSNLRRFEALRPYAHENRPTKLFCKNLGHLAPCRSCTSCHFCRCAQAPAPSQRRLTRAPSQAEDGGRQDQLPQLRRGPLVRQLPGDARGPKP
jgi:hypothetical protein